MSKLGNVIDTVEFQDCDNETTGTAVKPRNASVSSLFPNPRFKRPEYWSRLYFSLEGRDTNPIDRRSPFERSG